MRGWLSLAVLHKQSSNASERERWGMLDATECGRRVSWKHVGGHGDFLWPGSLFLGR